jgi:hypothetical protein
VASGEGDPEAGYSPQTVNEIFLYSTVSTLKPMVGIVVTISPEDRERRREKEKERVNNFHLHITKALPTPRKIHHYSPNLSLYKIVVLPAASSPTILRRKKSVN